MRCRTESTVLVERDRNGRASRIILGEDSRMTYTQAEPIAAWHGVPLVRVRAPQQFARFAEAHPSRLDVVPLRNLDAYLTACQSQSAPA